MGGMTKRRRRFRCPKLDPELVVIAFSLLLLFAIFILVEVICKN